MTETSEDDLAALPATPPKASSTLNIVGGALTGIWLLGLAIYVWVAWDAFAELAPNAVGDFLAGAFAPLAFLWLVLGFFQQGKELRHSGEALWLQGRELQNSVEQQRELVNVTRDQLKFESEMLKQQQEDMARRERPVLKLTTGGSAPQHGSDRRRYEFVLKNTGQECTDVAIIVNGKVTNAGCDVLVPGKPHTFARLLKAADDLEFTVVVTYLDGRRLPGEQAFRVAKVGSTFDITELPVGA